MAENLNYEVENSSCYKDIKTCTKRYGRLYTRNAAVCACPLGWRLPDVEDWKQLLSTVGGASIAGKVLKSKSGWVYKGGGTDTYGFSVLPGGLWHSKDNRYDYGSGDAFFWIDDSVSNMVMFDADIDSVTIGFSNILDKFSVRCIKDGLDKKGPMDYCSEISSSSIKIQSSSSTISYGTLKDPRDCHVYKTVVIGNQTWMAENLFYYGPRGSYCSKNVLTDSIVNRSVDSLYYTKRTKTHRLNDSIQGTIIQSAYYSWSVAMDSAGVWSSNGEGCGKREYDGGVKNCWPTYPVQGICPSGWHLPSESEFLVLLKTVGGGSTTFSGQKLKSVSGWRYNKDTGGTDDYGFSAYPTGYLTMYGDLHQEGYAACFWTATQVGGNREDVPYLELDYEDTSADVIHLDFARCPVEKDDLLPVRCIKNVD